MNPYYGGYGYRGGWAAQWPPTAGGFSGPFYQPGNYYGSAWGQTSSGPAGPYRQPGNYYGGSGWGGWGGWGWGR